MSALGEHDRRALGLALQSVRSSVGLHSRIVRMFGPAPSVERIRDIGTVQLRVLEWLHTRYDLPLPQSPADSPAPRFVDASHACAAAVAAEKEHLALYERLLQRAEEAEVLAQLRNLARAARDGHLPALHEWAWQLGRHRNNTPPGDRAGVAARAKRAPRRRVSP